TTKFFEDGSIDFPVFERNIEAQIDAGVDGIVISGTLGEGSSLSCEEKIDLVRSAKMVSNGRVPVIVCVAESNTKTAVSFVKAVKDAGVDGLMVLPPMRYQSDDRETVHYLQTIADATDLPIMLYNNPVAYKVLITIDMFKELAKDPKFQAIKESTDDIRTLTDLKNELGDRYKILSGVDDLAMESLVMGADGWVAGLVCAFPKETVAIYRLVKEGRIEEARAIYRWFFPLLHLDVSTKLVQNIKLAEVATGLGTEPVREPRLPLVGEERERVLRIIEEGLANRPILPELGVAELA
ncbi:dihydrodipicolinate synthase family protein, partial [Xanthovirga aplysinae]|uniref:dihydrodipicolinate synthase family protein n=1 Tax=Xanthovirga aplysinae TaxID=2529853 RepID=UPI0012BCFFD9